MIKKLHITLKTAILFLMPGILFAQAPVLGTTSNYVLFSTNGPISNTGISQLTGNVGTNNGSSTGFGNVNGVMHDADVSSAQAAVDLLALYSDLNTRIPTDFLAPVLGNGQILTEGVYNVSSATSLNLNLILDAENDPNALFIFQINGTFSSSAHAKIELINGAKACNVFWKIEGLADFATGTSLKGTIVANNAGINLNSSDTLEGRAMSTTGAITIDGVLAYTSSCVPNNLTGPNAPDLGLASCFGVFSSDGPVTNLGISTISGDVGCNVGLTTGFNPLLISGNIHPIPDLTTASCATDLLMAYNYLNLLESDIELLYPAQFGSNLVLTPHTYVLNGATTFTDTLYLNAEGNANAVFVLKLNGALESSSYSKVILMNGALAENVYWMVNGAVNFGDYSIFCGNIISQGAINLHTGTKVYGRILTGVGAIETIETTGLAQIASNCVTAVGMNETEILTDNIMMYPNPFENKFTIEIKNRNLSSNYKVKVFNSLGAEILSQSIIKENTIINCSSISIGVYFYKVFENDNEISTGKLISNK